MNNGAVTSTVAEESASIALEGSWCSDAAGTRSSLVDHIGKSFGSPRSVNLSPHAGFSVYTCFSVGLVALAVISGPAFHPLGHKHHI